VNKSVGYARVSTREQNLDRQIEVLKKYVDKEMIVTDKASGKDFERYGYQSLKHGTGKLMKGDTLYIKSLDRFSRNKAEAKKELEYFASIGVRVKVIDIPTTMMNIDEGQEWILNMVNNILVEVLTSIAENERSNIRQRQQEGIAVMSVVNGKRVSKRTNRPIGRPRATYPENWEQGYKKWKQGEIKAVEAMELLGLKKNTFYKLAKQCENN